MKIYYTALIACLYGCSNRTEEVNPYLYDYPIVTPTIVATPTQEKPKTVLKAEPAPVRRKPTTTRAISEDPETNFAMTQKAQDLVIVTQDNEAEQQDIKKSHNSIWRWNYISFPPIEYDYLYGQYKE